MPAWDQTGVPIHFHSSTISGSAAWMRARTLASIFPRQSPSSLILASISAEADFAVTGLFMQGSNSRTTALSSTRDLRRGLQPAPEDIRERPEHAGGGR